MSVRPFLYISLSISLAGMLASCAFQKHDENFVEPPQIQPTASVGYRLQIGDSIDVFVIEDSSFNGTFAVRSSGDVIMPKVGRVPVQGLSLSECEQRITSALKANQLKTATVIIDPGLRGETELGLTVRLSGEVAKTGRQTIKSLGAMPVTAYQAIVDAGGFLPFANKRKSYILRNSLSGVVRLNVDFDAIESGSAADPALNEGDCIIVPKKVFGL